MNIIFYTGVSFLACLKKDSKNIHVGAILKAAVEASGINKELVAKRAGYQRTSYYNHTQQAELSPLILLAYGKAIGHDFSEEVPQVKHYLSEEPATYQATAKLPETLEEALVELAAVYKRLASVQEKYTALLEEKKAVKPSK